MEKVDKTIDAICDWIQKELKREDVIKVFEIADLITALGNLKTSARLPESGETQGESVSMEMICVFHWLDCLYQDYLNGSVVGLNNPCDSCPELEKCNVSSITNFNLAGKKYGLKVGKIKENGIPG